jgi:hypothetical protein
MNSVDILSSRAGSRTRGSSNKTIDVDVPTSFASSLMVWNLCPIPIKIMNMI